jgi:thioester reductase-like protein
MSSRPPESVTNVVTGGLAGFLGRRWCVWEDFVVRLDWRCCWASIRKANDISAMEKMRVRLSIVFYRRRERINSNVADLFAVDLVDSGQASSLSHVAGR